MKIEDFEGMKQNKELIDPNSEYCRFVAVYDGDIVTIGNHGTKLSRWFASQLKLVPKEKKIPETKEVEMFCYLYRKKLHWHTEDAQILEHCSRVPSEDRVVKVETERI